MTDTPQTQQQTVADACVGQVAADAAAAYPGKHLIAAFDFDGTSIQGNSPVLLVRYLFHDSLIGKRIIAKVASWGIAYKLHLPQSEAWVRGQVFTAFEGVKQPVADAYLRTFYDEVIACQKRFRPQARAAMQTLREAGIEVLVVSATFGPIVRRAQESEPFDESICTEMTVDGNGCYTRKVLGECIEGDAKVTSITAWANERYGEGNWELVAAFGDHHSDTPMLSMAREAFAISPDSGLERQARESGWHILDWKTSIDKSNR